VDVDVDVSAPVMVAALVNGNETVGVIDAVSDDATAGLDGQQLEHAPLARGSAMESASHLDVMRVDELIDTELYAQGIELLERIVAMLTKLIDP
jgi:hypothetical protein